MFPGVKLLQVFFTLIFYCDIWWVPGGYHDKKIKKLCEHFVFQNALLMWIPVDNAASTNTAANIGGCYRC
jgi:hypothetical protein